MKTKFSFEILHRIVSIHKHALQGEDARAHMEEDALMADFIGAIAGGKYTDIDVVILHAKQVLTTSQIDFDRWYE